MKNYRILFWGIAIVLSSSWWSCNQVAQSAETASNTVANEVPTLKLVWQDEFEIDGLPDSSKWGYDVGDACDLPMGCGWGNNELQYYTNAEAQNARVENGQLIIEAHKEKRGRQSFTSARLVSKGKGDFKYGRVELRAQVPDGLGTWSALWMLPTGSPYGGWPRSGEIDIMEHVGFDKDTIFGTPHTKAFNGMIWTQKTGSIYAPKAENNFQVYAVEWDENKIDWYYNDVKYHTFRNSGAGIDEWPFDQPFHLIMNLAVGGNWGGQKGVAEDIWPKRMLVDYVRVYQ